MDGHTRAQTAEEEQARSQLPAAPSKSSPDDGGETFQQPLLKEMALRSLSNLDGQDAELRDWNYWYPDWTQWKFNRTLAYWIAMFYCEGSLLFTIGAGASMTSLVREECSALAMPLVDGPYFVGGIFFSLGGACGLLFLVNIVPGRTEGFRCMTDMQGWRDIVESLGWEPTTGYLLYFIGALFFNVNTIAALNYDNMVTWEIEVYVWTPAILGSICFICGGFIECYENGVTKWENFFTTSWLLSVGNAFGGVCFLLAALTGAVNSLPGGAENTETTEQWLVNFPYLIGSISFLIGSHCALWLWKSEQFGLGFVPALNLGERAPELEPSRDFEESMHAQYGCGRSSAWQWPWLFLYTINSSSSVVDICLTVTVGETGDTVFAHRVVESWLNLMLSHGVLMLASIVHHIPTVAPHSWLLIYMRGVLLVYCFNSILGVAMTVKGYDCPDAE